MGIFNTVSPEGAITEMPKVNLTGKREISLGPYRIGIRLRKVFGGVVELLKIFAKMSFIGLASMERWREKILLSLGHIQFHVDNTQRHPDRGCAVFPSTGKAC